MNPTTQSRKFIFVVDDDDSLLFCLNYWFTKKGHVISTFVSSEEMLPNLELLKPDLILIDINLDPEDGRKLCRYIKHEMGFVNPVILFSSYDYPGYNFAADGADGFIEKTYDALEIVNKSEKYLLGQEV